MLVRQLRIFLARAVQTWWFQSMLLTLSKILTIIFALELSKLKTTNLLAVPLGPLQVGFLACWLPLQQSLVYRPPPPLAAALTRKNWNSRHLQGQMPHNLHACSAAEFKSWRIDYCTVSAINGPLVVLEASCLSSFPSFQMNFLSDQHSNLRSIDLISYPSLSLTRGNDVLIQNCREVVFWAQCAIGPQNRLYQVESLRLLTLRVQNSQRLIQSIVPIQDMKQTISQIHLGMDLDKIFGSGPQSLLTLEIFDSTNSLCATIQGVGSIIKSKHVQFLKKPELPSQNSGLDDGLEELKFSDEREVIPEVQDRRSKALSTCSRTSTNQKIKRSVKNQATRTLRFSPLLRT
ncbi:hypothetical protein VP01_3139g1 [Puccinia sorghi]|uniref:Uncharacterized protein n=1 Tax=Puccinia sorghi TaxID=27349 RepID=A0A0L6UZ08_9BASI|nr:hypothetical protein VP01_3139g1 [Puccinia sorghi]